MSVNTPTNHFEALLKDAWAKKTDNQSLRNNLYTMLQANWSTFTFEQINIVRSYIEKIDQWTLESEGRQLASGSVVENPKQFSHCVRCHASFVAGDPDDRCIIPHVVDTTNAERISDVLYFQSKCCRSEAMAALHFDGKSCFYVSLSPRKNCYEGVHTTNAMAVEFWKRQNPGRGGTTIFPCHVVDGGCVRHAVQVTEGMFAQEGDFTLRRP